MRIDFIKMHGLGNDFIVLDAREEALPAITAPIARALSDRRTGIGCDQLILLEPSERESFRMRIFNSDGGEVEACGNATRAVAMLHGEPARIETAGGVLESPMAVNVGNPHAVFFVEDADAIDLTAIGPVIETDPLFPERINVNVASVVGDSHLKLHVWERGAGLTRACGTGACATAVAAIRKGLVQSPVTVTLPGGDLEIAWAAGSTIQMSGAATESYRGSFEWDDYA